MTAADVLRNERPPRTLHEIAEELRNSQTVGFAPLAAIADELDAIEGASASRSATPEGNALVSATPDRDPTVPTAEPQAMTLSHDRLVLQRKDDGVDEPVVLVRCPHMIGLCFEGDEFLSLLPCPCNEPSHVLAELVPRTDPTAERARDYIRVPRQALANLLRRVDPGGFQSPDLEVAWDRDQRLVERQP